MASLSKWQILYFFSLESNQDQKTRGVGYHLIWFNLCVPRTSFILWLAIRNRLATKDRIHSFTPNCGTTCVLCRADQESHSHLFFECSYSERVWRNVISKCDWPWQSSSWQSLIEAMSTQWKGKQLQNYIKKLCLAVIVYVIWGERNHWIFTNEHNDSVTTQMTVLNMVRSRLLSTKIKDTLLHRQVASSWQLPKSCFAHDVNPVCSLQVM